ncbi:MAG: SIS domain-containing protein [Bacteroidales bacterium]
MNNIEQILKDVNGFEEFAKEYFEYVYILLKQIDTGVLSAFVDELEAARQEQSTIFFIGNGGSAATASHMATDFGFGLQHKTKTQKPLRVLSLTDNNAVMLAISNDDGYDNLFVDQLRVLYQNGDKLVAISASGNSPNVVAAARWVKAQGGKVISLVGFDGGKLKPLSDVCLHVQTRSSEYGPVEDIHLIIDHLLAYWLQRQMLSK